MAEATTFHFYEPAQGHGLPHDPFKAIVAPRPIGWISSCDPVGRINLAPYSFFNAVSTHPPIVTFSSEGYKDSVRNIAATGEFVVNYPSRSLAEAMNRTSAPVAPEVDEFTLAGLETASCRLVTVPRVAAAPAALECVLLQIVQLHDRTGQPLENYLVLGEVIGVHIDQQYLHDGIFDLVAAQPIQRAGYQADYTTVGTTFQMMRPRASGQQ